MLITFVPDSRHLSSFHFSNANAVLMVWILKQHSVCMPFIWDGPVTVSVTRVYKRARSACVSKSRDDINLRPGMEKCPLMLFYCIEWFLLKVSHFSLKSAKALSRAQQQPVLKSSHCSSTTFSVLNNYRSIQIYLCNTLKTTAIGHYAAYKMKNSKNIPNTRDHKINLT